jgi:MFS family permease
MLFVARIVGGILSSANMPTVMAYVADITTAEERGKGMGIIGAATGLGFVFGPALGGIFSKISLTMPFFIAGASSIITFFIVMLVLKESLVKDNSVREKDKKASLWEAAKGPQAVLFILQLFISVSLAGLEATFAYFSAEKAGLDSVKLGYIFMIMGLASAVVQGGLIGKLTKRFGEGFVIQMGIIVSAIGFGLVLFVNSFSTAAIFLTIFGVGNGVIRPTVSALLTKTSSLGYGSSTGLLSSFDSLGRIIGPTLGGWLFSVSIGLPYISGILLSLVALILYRLFTVQSKEIQLNS